MLSKLCLVLGVFVFTLALRTYAHPLVQKLSALGIMATSYLALFFLTDSHLCGAIGAGSWLFLPWVDLIARTRKLTLPLESQIRSKTPPGAQAFPALSELTEEIEGSGFEHITDAGWEWEENQQFFRLFYHSGERLQASVCLVDQQEIAFYYLSLSSRAADGTLWITWNYPFSYSLQLAPQWRVNRLRSDLSFLEMFEEHRAFLEKNGVETAQLDEIDAETMQAKVQKEMHTQVAHNISTGVLQQVGGSEVRYSWRGLFFLWVQFLRDFVRLT